MRRSNVVLRLLLSIAVACAFVSLWHERPQSLAFVGQRLRPSQQVHSRAQRLRLEAAPTDALAAANSTLEEDPQSVLAAPDAGESRRSLLFNVGLYPVSVGLIYSLLTARDSPAFKDHVQRAIQGAVPTTGLRVLELGIGEAPNLPYYPSGTTLVGLDVDLPQPEFRRGVEVRAAQQGVKVYWVKGYAEKLPFEPNTFDAVVTTTVFCSVGDPEQALREVSRVLKPGGKLGYVEHVAADEGSLLEQQQLLLDPLQVVLADNCHLHRDTDGLIRGSIRGNVEEGQVLFASEEAAERYQVWQMWPIAQQAFGIVAK